MKYLLFAMLVTMHCTAFAQAPIDSTSKRVANDSTYRKAIALRFRSAGEELTTGSNMMLVGTGLMVGGGLLAAFSNGENGGIIGGASISGLGFLFDIIGIGKIGIAGKRLRGRYE